MRLPWSVPEFVVSLPSTYADLLTGSTNSPVRDSHFLEYLGIL